MSERMHLRARLAMEFYKLTVLANSEDDRSRDACIAWAVPAADALLAELQKGELEKYPTAVAYEAVCKARDKWQGRAEAAEARVAELDTRLHKLNIEYGRVTDGWSAASTNEQRLQARVKEQDGIIEARNKSLGDAEARVRDLTAQVEALNHLDEDTAEEYREWKARAERAEAQLAAIDAAKAGEPPMPKISVTGMPMHQEQIHKVEAWGRQGWDAAAALRVDLEQSAQNYTICRNLLEATNKESAALRVELAKAKEIQFISVGAVTVRDTFMESEIATQAYEGGRLEEREKILPVALDMLHAFTEEGHPGEACVRSGWISRRTFVKWCALLEPPAKEEK